MNTKSLKSGENCKEGICVIKEILEENVNKQKTVQNFLN